MSSFFTIPGAQKKRKRRPERDDESISGSSESEDGAFDEPEASEEGSDSENEGETAAEKRLRLASRYLENVKEQVEVGFNAEDVDRDILLERRLREDVAEAKGKVYRTIAGELAPEKASHTLFRGNTLPTTSVATCAPFAYTVHKDRTLVKWRLQDLPADQFPQTTKKKPKKQAPPRRQPDKILSRQGDRAKAAKNKNYQGHTGEILCVAASEDGQYVVTGGSDRRLIIHDAKTLKPLRVFTHHRDAVTGLAFRRGTNQLYTASKDRTVKVWSLEDGPPFAYVETLYGHADEVVDIAALSQERCVTVGARDRTARLWKVVEESQLVFRGGGSEKKTKGDHINPKSLAAENSMDRVAMLDDELFVTGSQNGSISLWSISKKKPLFILPHAHGFEPPLLPEEASAEKVPDLKQISPEQPRWITALRTLPYSDVIISGSWDGCVRLWRLSEDKRSIEPVGVLGQPSPMEASPEFNGFSGAESQSQSQEVKSNGTQPSEGEPWFVKGVVNDISLFERGYRGADGLCVVAAVGKEHRLGRWKTVQGGKNGAVVFEIPRREKAAEPTNGVDDADKDVEMEG
ncbi:component of the u3 snoRNP complex [Apiospora kogelbergensis]|uniref:component of the u3 snoRNP complex n=1 Tax=Apiospora kogelbergensis TaxID=1337665 RepID=UPI0031310ADC